MPKNETTLDVIKRIMWPTGTIVLVGLVTVSILGWYIGGIVNSGHNNKEVQAYEASQPKFIVDAWAKQRKIVIHDSVIKDVKALNGGDVSGGIIWGIYDVWNKPIAGKWNDISPRFVFRKENSPTSSNQLAIHVESWKGDHCDKPDIHFADLARRSGGGFVVRLCVAKAIKLARSAGVVATGKVGDIDTVKLIKGWWHENKDRKTFWGCILAHEIGHSYLYTHTTGGVGLMNAGGAACEVSKHEWAIFGEHILPRIRK